MGSDDPVERSPLFASAVWTPDDDEKRRAIAAAWLEEQAAYPFIREVGDRSLELLALEPGQTPAAAVARVASEA